MLRSIMNSDCAHYMCAGNQCKVLDKKNCVGCSFFTTQANSDKRKQAANERLRHLPVKKQLEIADKYYGGVSPWLAHRNTGVAVN